MDFPRPDELSRLSWTSGRAAKAYNKYIEVMKKVASDSAAVAAVESDKAAVAKAAEDREARRKMFFEVIENEELEKTGRILGYTTLESRLKVLREEVARLEAKKIGTPLLTPEEEAEAENQNLFEKMKAVEGDTRRSWLEKEAQAVAERMVAAWKAEEANVKAEEEKKEKEAAKVVRRKWLRYRKYNPLYKA